MPKPISQRGFTVREGDYFGNSISYSIESSGLECVTINSHKKRTYISIQADNDQIVFVLIQTPQIRGCIHHENGVYNSGELPPQTISQNVQQAEQIFKEAKRILKVEEKLPSYQPKLSHALEATIFNLLDVESPADLTSFLKEKSEINK